MECRASIVCSYLLMPGLDPSEVRRGQFLTLVTGLSTLLMLQLLVMLAEAAF
jgi:hypothetical protein